MARNWARDWIWVKKSKGEKDANLDHVCLMLEYLGAETVAGVGKLEVVSW